MKTFKMTILALATLLATSCQSKTKKNTTPETAVVEQKMPQKEEK